MKNKIYILFFSIAVCINSSLLYAQTVTNDGLTITNQAGLTMTIVGSYVNQTNGTLGIIDNAGTISVTGDWTNNSANTVFSTNTGLVELLGTANPQTIGGTSSTGFYNFTTNNTFATFPQIILGLSIDVKNTFTMTSGKINLAGFTLTHGTSAATPGTLAYTAGFLYGGNLKRWMAAAQYGVTTAAGHFPMGGSGDHYRPFWMGITTADLTTGGTVTLNHNAVYPVNTDVATHTDATWAGGTLVEGVTQSTWDVSTADGFTADAATRFDISLGGQGFGTPNPADIDLTLAASTVGTFVASTSAYSPIEGNRTDLTKDELDNTGGGQAFRLGTRHAAVSPLPIELLSFDAKVDGSNVNTKWVTATEINNDYFTLERSADATIFEKVAIIDGAGNSNSILNYSSIDDAPYKGVSYYRLKQTDFDGNYSYSNTVAVEFNNTNDFNLNVYPNPSTANDNINLSFTGNKGEEVLVVVYDASGKKSYSKIIIIQTDGNNVSALDPSGKLSPGVYLITATSNQAIYSKKLIVE